MAGDLNIEPGVRCTDIDVVARQEDDVARGYERVQLQGCFYLVEL